MEKNNSSVKATNKNIRSSARKLSLVCNFIKGKKADIALRDLEFTRKRIAKDISKTVKSAISNAENNYQYDIDNLYIKEAYVGKSLVMKRYRPRAKGRASPIKKPFSRVTIILEEKKSKDKKVGK
jgi:large subunit ribosomal protein L22|tara:strand:- start:451 stop:825 length:375 start_codon:yes stop_codon:yes gene_type:complete